jgi:hypothetical protein
VSGSAESTPLFSPAAERNKGPILEETVAMPANNFSLVFRSGGRGANR